MKSWLNRRSFIKSSIATASILPIFNVLSRQTYTIGPSDDQVNMAIIGYGYAGEDLVDSAVRIPGVRIKAVCDIWEYRRKMAKWRLKSVGHDVNVYEDYKTMLDAEGDVIDCVIVAVPDWMHCEISCACLQAGKHVYCETPMSNSLKDVREMVLCQRRTGKLLQVGLQRRSNPRYIHAIEQVINKHNVLGDITHGYAQWNRSVGPFLSVRERLRLPAVILEKYGYETMEHFLNWRWFPKYGGGPFMDLAPHQLDVFMWAWACAPCSVMATGGNEHLERNVNDSVMAVYEFVPASGKKKRFIQQILSSSSRDGFYEQFYGLEGIIKISEYERYGNYAWPEYRESGPGPSEWRKHHSDGIFFGRPELEVGPTKYGYEMHERTVKSFLSENSRKPPYMFHLENFFSAIRHGTALSCPAEVGYRVTFATLAATQAIKEHRTINFKPGGL